MKGQLIRATESNDFVTLLFKLEDKRYALTYTGKKYRNYSVWSQFKVGDLVEGLEWKDEKKKLLNADSPVHFVH